MTPDKARRRLRSLRYLERLEASTPEKEAELMLFVLERGGEALIDGYRVKLTDGQLVWEQLPKTSHWQLPLFKEEDDNGSTI